MGIRQLSMVTVQVSDFDGMLTWYRLVRVRDPEGNVIGLTMGG